MDLNTTLTIIATLVAIPPVVEFIYFLNRRLNASRLLVGVVPLIDVQEGKDSNMVLKRGTSLMYGFTKSCQAEKVDPAKINRQSLCSLCSKGQGIRVRSNDGLWDIPIFLENYGNRASSRDALLTVTFRCFEEEGEMDIADVETEGQEVISIYTQNPEVFAKTEALMHIVPAKVILDTYRDLQERSPLITLVANIESKVYAIMHLSLKVEPRISRLCILFRLDDPEANRKTTYFVQPLRPLSAKTSQFP